MSKGWAGGSTRRWRLIRGAVLQRDNYLCQLRLPTWGSGPRERCQVQADCVHHTVGRLVSGDDPAYLVASCTPCNLRIGNPTQMAQEAPVERITKW